MGEGGWAKIPYSLLKTPDTAADMGTDTTTGMIVCTATGWGIEIGFTLLTDTLQGWSIGTVMGITSGTDTVVGIGVGTLLRAHITAVSRAMTGSRRAMEAMEALEPGKAVNYPNTVNYLGVSGLKG